MKNRNLSMTEMEFMLLHAFITDRTTLAADGEPKEPDLIDKPILDLLQNLCDQINAAR